MSIPVEAVNAASDAIIDAAYGQELPEAPEDLARAALEAAAPYMTQPVIHDVDWALTVLQKCGVKTADQFDALVTLQKLTP